MFNVHVYKNCQNGAAGTILKNRFGFENASKWFLLVRLINKKFLFYLIHNFKPSNHNRMKKKIFFVCPQNRFLRFCGPPNLFSNVLWSPISKRLGYNDLMRSKQTSTCVTRTKIETLTINGSVEFRSGIEES